MDSSQFPLTIDRTWEVAKAFLTQPENSKSRISENQIASYNSFLDEIPKIFHSFSKDKIPGKKLEPQPYPHFYLDFENFVFDNPLDQKKKKLYPTECSLRGIPYESKIRADVILTTVTEKGSKKEVKKDILLMKLPVMVGSKICNLFGKTDEEIIDAGEDIYDLGGYFYTVPIGTKALDKKGGGQPLLKRVIYAQERIVHSTPFFITRKNRKSEGNLPYTSHIEMRSLQGYSSMTIFQIGITSDFRVKIDLPWIKERNFPFLVVLYALGYDREFFKKHALCSEKDYIFFERCIEDAYGTETKEQALRKIAGSKEEEKYQFAIYTIEETLFSHLNGKGDFLRRKAFFLMHLYRQKILHHRGEIADTERDHFSNKRIQTTGLIFKQHLYSTLKKNFGVMKKKVADSLRSENVTDPLIYLEEIKLTNAWKKALINNNWSVVLGQTEGISQIADNNNRMAKVAGLNKLYLGIGGKEGGKVKVVEPRDFHLSQAMKIDPYDTPEGGKVGLLKNLSVSTLITENIDPSKVIKEILSHEDTVSFDDSENPFLYHKIFVNGVWIGGCYDIKNLVNFLKQKRREGKIHFTTTIFSRKGEVWVLTDQGKMVRPLLRVEDGKLLLTSNHISLLKKGKITFKDLVNEGIVEYLGDFEEEAEDVFVAENPREINKKHSHCEIHESFMAGFSTNESPFYNRNPAARNCYEDSMKKQGIGIPASNFQRLFENHMFLNYPQKPLSSTRHSFVLKHDDLPSEQCAMVAIIADDNEEDCIIMNQSSVDRGFGVVTLAFVYSVEIGDDCFLGKPTEKMVRFGNDDYSLIEEDGVIGKGQKVKSGCVLICALSKNPKYDPTKKLDPNYFEKEYTSDPIVFESNFTGIVDQVQMLDSPSGNRIVRVKILQTRPPMIGDKFSAKHGQKGTVAHLRPQQNMPFNSEGISPDIMINTAALPSRMTAAMLVEMLTGKAVISRNIHEYDLKNRKKKKNPFKKFLLPDGRADATAYISELTVDEISKELARKGWDRNGDEHFCDGITGLPVSCAVFFGPVQYHRLLHIAELKAHARSFGKTTSLFRQPVEGKANGGGGRTGVQERDVLVSHAAPGMLKDALHDRSDPYKVKICPGCETLRDEPGYCSLCETKI